MNEFRKSLLLTASICGYIASPPMLLSIVWAHLSVTSEAARIGSLFVSGAGVLLIVFSTLGMKKVFRAGKSTTVAPTAKTSGQAIASIIVGFPLFGLMTWGIASLIGIALGLKALHRACTDNNVAGKPLAIAGVCISFSTIPLLITMLLFLGP